MSVWELTPLTTWEDPAERETELSPELGLGSISTVDTTAEDDKRAANRERPFPFGFSEPADPPRRTKRTRKARP